VIAIVAESSEWMTKRPTSLANSSRPDIGHAVGHVQQEHGRERAPVDHKLGDEDYHLERTIVLGRA
jgi:hypothetical protein